jgi:2-polyprenyl-6-hydroxyphenyl methylase/3-demethylubiquinone-9 3-methyltransferase
MEVIEHVADPAQFIDDCAALIRPGGIMICSTINRTLKAFSFAIVGAEYILRWLPKGTHQYEKLVKPTELTRWLTDAGMDTETPVGASLNPLTQRWSFSNDLSINYFLTAKTV